MDARDKTMDVFKGLKRLKTILIDDDEWIRDAMSIFFASEGCSIQTLETAEEALKVCEKERFDIIIVDYMLPGMNGIAFLKALENLIKNQNPVPLPMIKILITAHGDDEIVTLAKKAGVHAIVHKPFTPEAIGNAIRSHMGNSSHFNFTL
ncbi:MAG: response regulator [Desulfobacterium sp.]|jgi:CheY-like chemotaxis protein|nr:response regulator [Desulfobacterium sp.]